MPALLNKTSSRPNRSIGGRKQGSDRIGLPNVGGDGEHGAASLFSHGRGLFQFRHAPACQRYRVSGRLQRQRSRPANPAASSGNDGDLYPVQSFSLDPFLRYLA